jgi:phosphoribosylglycinamide formyltransferase-1
VLAQAEVPIESGDTSQSLEQRVLAAEHQLYPAALADFVSQQSRRA